MTPIEKTVNKVLFGTVGKSFDCNRVLSWLRQRYDVDVRADVDGYTVSAQFGKFIPRWHKYTSGKCDSLSVAACIVALRVNGYSESAIHEQLKRK
jgi:hypothetical protein